MHYSEDDVVYVLTCSTNGKKYIGRTCNPRKRFKVHMSKMRNNHHSVEDMNDDFARFGEEAFKFSVICKTIIDKDTEGKMIKALKTYNRDIGYNYKDRRANMFAREEAVANVLEVTVVDLLKEE